ncbi:MAG: sigma-70 family RNA polymerase sigma factor [Ruminococcus sp.]|nr:sigma-70 family RNA polymerase sigma factor [Ruminococcus sp.]
MDTFQNLIKEAKNGNKSAWNEIDTIYRPKLYSYCYKWFKNTEDAQDATQEILIKCYKKLNLLNDDSKFENWLFMIARNECNEIIRKRKKSVDTVENDEETDALANISDDCIDSNPEQIYESKEQLNFLVSLLNTLPKEQKFCFIQRVLYDMPFQRIAMMAGVSESTIKSRYSYAKKSLRKSLRSVNSSWLYIIFPAFPFRKFIGKKGIFAISGNISGFSSVALPTTAVVMTMSMIAGAGITSTINDKNYTPENNSIIIEQQPAEDDYSIYNPTISNNINSTSAQSNTTANSKIISPTNANGTIAIGAINSTDSASSAVGFDNNNDNEVVNNNSGIVISPTGGASANIVLGNGIDNTKSIIATLDENNCIPDEAYANRNDIEQVIIPATTKEIGARAFYSAANLKSVIFEGNICEEIGNNAFAYCSSLLSIDLSSVRAIDNNAFSMCSNLQQVKVSNNLETVNTYAFYNDTNLDNINASDNIKSVGQYAFSGTAFEKNNSNYLTSGLYWGNAFIRPYENATEVKIYSGTTVIADGAFMSNSNIQKVEIPSSVKVLPANTFTKSSISEIILNEGLERIEAQNFGYTENLKKITIPKSVTYISENCLLGLVDETEKPQLTFSIRGYSNSAAQAYAKSKGLLFRIIGY